MARSDGAGAVLARTPGPVHVAIKGTSSALRFLDRRVASLLAMTISSEPALVLNRFADERADARGHRHRQRAPESDPERGLQHP